MFDFRLLAASVALAASFSVAAEALPSVAPAPEDNPTT